MSVDEKDRAAYERGQEAREGSLDQKIRYEIGSYMTDSESERDAFNKGWNGEQLDEDKKDDKSSSGGCFLTTACVQSMGLRDDCMELTTLRRFRDEHMLATESGRADVEAYYLVAPRIVRAIDSRPDAAIIYGRIYTRMVVPCVRMIRTGQPVQARAHYTKWLRNLEAMT